MTEDLNHPDGAPDFGDDADVVLPDDPQFNEWLATAAPSLNAPPSTPRAEMWAAVHANSTVPGAKKLTVLPLYRARWFVPATIAAALLLGVGIDRAFLRTPGETAPTVAGHAGSGPRAGAGVASTGAPLHTDRNHLYHLAAVQTLSQAEALLTAYRASDVPTHDPAAARQLGVWGREVLSSTRLLIDSPAGDDPQLRPLLNDLELVLVQVISVSGTPLDSAERRLINQTMRDRDLLPRIRTAVPAGIAGAASSE